ncbi:hypothetical protein ACKC9G_03035 [Pokkaliibacter sp. CJK22405]|uniref:hypothetical protein n=1 Tax=Pokkaliibacter sp. CJK22405 TaxID=3384615 RepID=UPI00398469FC
MTEEYFTQCLQGRTVDELHRLRLIMEQRVEEKKAKSREVKKVGFRASLNELAESSGLDINRLMREAAQWQKR